MRRRVSVKGLEGIPATVVVTVVRDKVWLSISPPFTWEAIMDPVKVDELMHVLELATDEVRQVGYSVDTKEQTDHTVAATGATASRDRPRASTPPLRPQSSAATAPMAKNIARMTNAETSPSPDTA